MIITLCGSTKFKKEYEEINKILTLAGHIVISVGFFRHADKTKITEKEDQLLDEIHLKKIEISDAIYVINKDGYIGKSTKNEIAYAKTNGRKIYYHCENIWQQVITNEILFKHEGT